MMIKEVEDVELSINNIADIAIKSEKVRLYNIHPLQHVILAKNSSSALPQANAILESLFP